MKLKLESDIDVIRLNGAGKRGKKGRSRKGFARGDPRSNGPAVDFDGGCSELKDCRKRLADLKKKDAGSLEADQEVRRMYSEQDDGRDMRSCVSLEEEMGHPPCDLSEDQAEDIALSVVELPKEAEFPSDRRLKEKEHDDR